MFTILSNNSFNLNSNSQSNLITNTISQKKNFSTSQTEVSKYSPSHQLYINEHHKRASHPFHMVDPSIWPFLVSWGAFGMVFNMILFFNNPFTFSTFFFHAVVVSLFYSVYAWCRDICTESDIYHTIPVQNGLRFGFVLFIVSEVFFFFSLFLAFFYNAINPAIAIGCVWPPIHTQAPNMFGLPLLNTCILLISGVTLTWSHYALVLNKRSETVFALVLTIALGLYFTGLQCVEYVTASFSMPDNVYTSLFYMLTGFHGFHVLMGSIMLIVTAVRAYYGHFSKNAHIGFETAAWYWHFVDVVWIFLYISIYCWGA